MNKRILFLCTGNYYRSRFAEEFFNHLAQEKHLVWRADSRGLAEDMAALEHPGTISKYAEERLIGMHVSMQQAERVPERVSDGDFTDHEKIIALNETEHRPIIEHQFREYANRVSYWTVADVDKTHPGVALPKLERLVNALVDSLA